MVRVHIAMGVFSEECFPCFSPTTVLVVVPDARLHILFTLRKRRKNDEIEAHSLHTSSLPDAAFSSRTNLNCLIRQMNRLEMPYLYFHLITEPKCYRNE